MIIWIASYPRSGNRYFRTLLHYYYGIASQSIYSTRSQPLPKSPEEIRSMLASSETFFVKTHELPNDDSPAIYLVRDGRDSIISYTHFIRDVECIQREFSAILHDVLTSPDYFGGWGNHVMTWTRRGALTAVVKFESLIQRSSPLVLLQRVLSDVGYPVQKPLTLEPPPTFDQLQQRHPLLFRKGQSGYWKTEMPPEQHRLFWNINGEVMRQMGYMDEML